MEMEEGHRGRVGRTWAGAARARLRIGRRRQQIMATDNRRDAPAADEEQHEGVRKCVFACRRRGCRRLPRLPPQERRERADERA